MEKVNTVLNELKEKVFTFEQHVLDVIDTLIKTGIVEDTLVDNFLKTTPEYLFYVIGDSKFEKFIVKSTNLLS
jgi:hypothetical protein